ncbi:MAG: polyketide synthase, partial [Desulfobacteraceae bacterium]|nr:polyketide synthase [Desulfobacteraceae bacterium]
DGILAARLSYFLNLDGPAMAINTTCSSGLVAAHQACQSLRAGECDSAIAAGVNLMLTPAPYMAMSRAGMLSEKGRCSAFDKEADGMVPGEAVAAVVLRRLSQAQADGDPVYAVIRGSGVNYDGKTNGITAPSGVAQTALLKSVYDRYRVNPGDIEYIVTHGTGTKLGDPV